MSDAPQGPGWWLASDGKYYPPQPGQQPPPPPPPLEHDSSGSSSIPGSPASPGGDESAPKKTGRWILAAAAAVLLLLVIGGIVLAALALGGSDSDSDTATAAIATPTTEAAQSPPELTEEPEPASPPTTSKSDAPDIQVVETGLSVGEGYDGGPRAYAGAVIKNNGSATEAFFEVVFTFKDAAGKAVGTETQYVYAVEAGGTAHAAVESASLQGAAVSVDASAIVQDSFMPYEGRALPVTVTGIGAGSFGGLEVRGTASNPTDEVIDAAGVQCVLRKGGSIVGGVYTYLDTLVPNGEVAWDTSVLDDWLDADTAECSAGFYD